MTDSQKENRFLICIMTVPQEGNNHPTPLFQSTNNGVPDEIVISQPEAYVDNLKKVYAEKFDKNTTKFWGE